MSLGLRSLTVRRDGCPTIDHVTLDLPAGSYSAWAWVEIESASPTALPESLDRSA